MVDAILQQSVGARAAGCGRAKEGLPPKAAAAFFFVVFFFRGLGGFRV